MTVAKRWAIAVVVLLVFGISGYVLGRRVQSPDEAAARARAPLASWVTVGVERRVLSRTLITRGEVRPQTDVKVGVPSSVDGEPFVTGLPRKPGEDVMEGDTVLEVSGRPVIVLQGNVPAYRSLKPGMRGDDVGQLQAALQRGGCAATDHPGLFGPATRACVAGMYGARGYDPIPVSPTDATDLAGAQQAVAETRAAVDSAELALAKARSGTSSSDVRRAEVALAQAQRALEMARADATDSASAAQSELDDNQNALDRTSADPEASPEDVTAARQARDASKRKLASAERFGADTIATAADAVTIAEADLAEAQQPSDVSAEMLAVEQARTALAAAQTRASAVAASTGATVPQGEVVFVPTLPARVQSAPGSVGPVVPSGSGSDSDTPPPASEASVVTLSSPNLMVAVTLRAAQRREVEVGMPVELLDEASNSDYRATVLSIDGATTIGADGQPGFTASMVPSAETPLPFETVGQSLRVTIAAASTGTRRLVVPVTAMTSAADGSDFVSVVSAGALVTTKPSRVRVKAGLSADGYVTVEPVESGSLAVGDQVVVGR